MSINVAKVICLDLGWHLEFKVGEDGSSNFLLVIPGIRYGEEQANILESIKPDGQFSPPRLDSNRNVTKSKSPSRRNMTDLGSPAGYWKHNLVGLKTELMDSPPRRITVLGEESAMETRILRSPHTDNNFDSLDPKSCRGSNVDCLLVSYPVGRQFM